MKEKSELFKQLLTYIYSADHEVVTKILEDNIKSMDPDERDLGGETALHQAIKVGSDEIVDILLKKGYKADAKDKCNATPLYDAAFDNYIYGAKALIASIGDSAKRKEYVNHADNKKITPLHIAIFNKSGSELIKLLLENGADVDAVAIGFYDIEGHNNLTPLHLAALLGNLEAVVLLVSYKADLNKVTRKGQTALELYQEEFDNPEEFEAAVKEGKRLYEERQAAQAKTANNQTTLGSSASGLIQGGEDKATTYTGLTRGQELSTATREQQAKEEKKAPTKHTGPRTCSVRVDSVQDLEIPAAKRTKV
jgi:ankyrin repeat protein